MPSCPAIFFAAYGRLFRVFKPSACFSNGAGTEVPPPGQARTLGRRHQSVGTQKPGGRRGKLRNRESRTPEREECTPTERGVSRGPSPWTRSLGTFSGARESTPPVGAGPDKPEGLPKSSGKKVPSSESPRKFPLLFPRKEGKIKRQLNTVARKAETKGRSKMPKFTKRALLLLLAGVMQIGRASCRERV